MAVELVAASAAGSIEPLEAVLWALPDRQQNKKHWPRPFPWSGTLEVPLEPPFRLAAEVPGYWAPAVEVAADHVIHRLVMIPLGTIEGRLSPGAFETDHSPSVIARIQAREAFAATVGVDLATRFDFPCSVAGQSWRCAVPVGEHDLKLDVEGHVPRYAWALVVEPEEPVDLGTIALVRGSSCAGWIEAGDRQLALEEVTMRIVPQQLGWQGEPSEREQHRIREVTARPTKRGFFQLVGLEPSTYTLVAEGPGGWTARLEAVQVGTDEEVFLDDTLVLEPGRELELVLTPPADQRGLPWTVVLMRYEPRSEYVHTLSRQLAEPDGSWRATDLGGTSYRIEILDSRHSSWKAFDIDPATAPSPLVVELGSVSIVGRVSIGGEPLEADLVFGSTSRRPQVRLSADQDGRFQGDLPHEGTWPVDVAFAEGERVVRVEPVVVARAPGKSVAEVEVVLPDTAVRGRVSDPLGEGVESLVYFRSIGEEAAKQATARTDAEGRFELLGLAPGSLEVAARRGRQASRWHQIDLEEGRETENLALRLAAKDRLHGRVLSAQGAVAGAAVIAIPVSARGETSWPAEGMTAIDGSFALEVVAEAGAVDLVTIPPGLGLRLQRVVAKPQDGLDVGVTSPTGSIILRDPSLLSSFVHYDGAAVPLPAIRGLLFRTGRLEPQDGGLAFRALAPGTWSFCPGPVLDQAACQEALVTPGSVVDLGSPASTSGSGVEQ